MAAARKTRSHLQGHEPLVWSALNTCAQKLHQMGSVSCVCCLTLIALEEEVTYLREGCCEQRRVNIM